MLVHFNGGEILLLKSLNGLGVCDYIFFSRNFLLANFLYYFRVCFFILKCFYILN